MKRIWREILFSLLLGAVLPGMLLSAGLAYWDARSTEETVAYASEDAEQPHPVTVRMASETREMELEDYLTGVLLAEMPAWFEPDALKAQAVAARTYTLKAQESGGKHGDGSICTDSFCCQAYISAESYLQQHTQAELERVCGAVKDTAGEVVTYDGSLIEATYFSCSGGSTEDAQAVWGADFPYLKAVDSPGEENAVHYRDQVTFSRKELESLLEITLPEEKEQWIMSLALTPGGGVASVEIGGKVFTGTALRSLLGLRSTAFRTEVTPDGICFETKGFGHRVGLSQYGADAMAVSGKDYREILAHYYQGTLVENYWEKGK